MLLILLVAHIEILVAVAVVEEVKASECYKFALLSHSADSCMFLPILSVQL